jgi:Mg-chelatase subunit ChlD
MEANHQQNLQLKHSRLPSSEFEQISPMTGLGFEVIHGRVQNLGSKFDDKILLRLVAEDHHGTGPDLGRQIKISGPPLTVILMVDISGSMGGEPIALVKQSLLFILDSLKPGDRLSLVCFNHEAFRVFDAAITASADSKASARSSISALNATGGTSIRAGVITGMQALAEANAAAPQATKRLMLLTDGQGVKLRFKLIPNPNPNPRCNRFKQCGGAPVHHR